MAILDGPLTRGRILLFEKYGTSETLYKLIQEICEKILDSLDRERHIQSFLLKDIVKDLKFLGSDAKVLVVQKPSYDQGGQVDSDKLWLRKNDQKIYGVFITVFLDLSRDTEYIQSNLLKIIQHELEHCYTIWVRLSKEKTAGDEFANTYLNVKSYLSDEEERSLENFIIRRLRQVFYVTSKIERNAYMAETSRDIEKLYRENKQIHRMSLSFLARQTSYGKHLDNVKDIIEDFKVAKEEEKNFESVFCEVLKRFRPGLKDLTYGKALKWLDSLYSRSEKKFLNTLGKLVYEVVSNNGKLFEGRKGKVIDLVFSKK